MKFKNILFIFILLFFSVSVVSAADFNNVTELSADVGDSFIADSFLDSSNIQNEIYLSDTGTFDDLQVEINEAPSGSVLNLTRDYNGAYGSRIQFNKDLTIDGQGHTLDCLNTECSAFYSSSGNIILKNLKIINGHNDYNYEGGAIHIDGSAQYTIINCTFIHNWADDYGGAIYNGAHNALTIINSTFESNSADDMYGGAVYSAGSCIVENSTFVSNSAYENGGAIFSSSSVDVYNCIFDSNTALDHSGGAINVWDNVTAVNSIFRNNYAEMDGGAIDCENVSISGCLFESNKVQDTGGAIYSYGLIYLDNSTFKYNSAGDAGGAIRGGKIFINYNQDENQSFNTFFIGNEADIGGAIYILDKKLYVKNTEFSSNKALVDGGAIYSSCDSPREGPTVTNCLFEGNKATGAKSQCYGGAIRCKDCDVYIENSTFKDNYAEDYGGAVYADNIFVNNNQGSNDAFNTFFINNKAKDNDGGALYSEYNIDVKNTLFTGNGAYEDGGAIFCCDDAYITNSLFESNIADGAKSSQCEGGAVYCKDDLTVDNCTFNKNYAYDYGGAIYADTLAFKQTYSYFDSNTAYDNQGGAIWVNKFREDVKYATFTNNIAGRGANDDGGAIYIDDENWITFSQCIFVNNTCGDEGGAIYLDSSSSHLTLKNNIFVSNSASYEGQTVYNCGYYDTISNNWWGGNNPSSGNDQLIEWKAWPKSNVHHSDNNPLSLTLKLTPESCNVNDQVLAYAGFIQNGGSPCNDEMRTDYIFLMPSGNIKFDNRTNHENYVNEFLVPQKSGTYAITANLFGQMVSKTLSVSDYPMFTSLSNNNPGVMVSGYDNSMFTSNLMASGYDNSIENVLADDLANNQTGNNASAENDQSPAKSINQSGNSNNIVYLALALVLIALCGIVVWRKMKN